MAILKHLPVHNKYYQDAVIYFLFQHDDHARPIYSERHKMILRDNVLIDAINTDVWSYSVDCQIANQHWHKNQEARDVKSHHIIISFPKEDREEHGLTPEIAQEIGMEFARKHFGGHQCIVATHNDGNNHSGNIHLHICFNSLRIKDTEPPEYSDLARDYKAGYKFQASGKCIHYLKADLERMCREWGLSQIPLNRPAKQKITNEEYWAAHRGQERLDQKIEAIHSVGGKPSETKFQTELNRIRKAIDDTKAKSSTVDEFMTTLKRDYNITVTESRGRWSYLPENRQRPITWRRLGDDYG